MSTTRMPVTNFIDQQNKYWEKLREKEWKLYRDWIIERDGHKCRICGSPHYLQVHHTTYLRHSENGEWFAPWEYHQSYLITLCNSCHKLGHQHFKIQVKEI